MASVTPCAMNPFVLFGWFVVILNTNKKSDLIFFPQDSYTFTMPFRFCPVPRTFPLCSSVLCETPVFGGEL
jgi:hypothetical protein